MKTIGRRLLCLVVAALMVNQAQGALQGTYDSCKTLDTTYDFRLYWSLNGTHINAAITAKSLGWVAWGISAGGTNPMIGSGLGSSIVLAWAKIDGRCNEGCVGDYYADKYDGPVLAPPENQLSVMNYFEQVTSTGLTTVEFSRPIEGGDQFHKDITPSADQVFIWALNPNSVSVPNAAGVPSKHLPDSRGFRTFSLGIPSNCSSGPVTQPPVATTNSYTNGAGTWKVDWSASRGNSTMYFTIRAQTDKWLAIGFNSEASMVGADVVVGWIDPNTNAAVISDRHASQRAMPEIDAVQNIVATGGYTEKDANGNTWTILSFYRKFQTTDSTDYQFNETTRLFVLWAYGTGTSAVDYASNTFSKHYDKGYVQMNLLSGCIDAGQQAQDGTPLRFVHGMLMMFAWCVLITSGIFLAAYFKSFFYVWFRFHMVFQSLGLLTMLAAFIIIFLERGGVYIPGLHHILGGIIIILAMVQMILGVISHAKYDPHRLVTPIWPDKIHWWLGRGVTSAAFVNLFLGVWEIGKPFNYRSWRNSTLPPYILLLVWIVVTFVTWILFICIRRKPKAEKEKEVVDGEGLIDTPRHRKASFSRPRPAHLISRRIRGIFVAWFFVSFGLFAGFTATVYTGFGPRAQASLRAFPDNFTLCMNFKEYTLPARQTTYVCRGFRFPSDKEYHITKFTPIEGNKNVLHHMILYKTPSYIGDEYRDCASMPEGSLPLFAWAVGMDGLTTPPDVGFRVGQGNVEFAALQIHYDNPTSTSNTLDSSGVIMEMTGNLRPIDAGYFVLGVRTPSINIPARRDSYTIRGDCSADTTRGLPDESYTVFASALHMHRFGRKIVTRQYRTISGVEQEIGRVGCDMFFDFNDQSFAPTNATIKPGDRFETYCVYDSSKSPSTIRGCETTDCEMCLNYIAYYPAIPNDGTCISPAQEVPFGNFTC